MLHLFALKIMNLGVQSWLFFFLLGFKKKPKQQIKDKLLLFSFFCRKWQFFFLEQGSLDYTLWKVNMLWVEQLNVLSVFTAGDWVHYLTSPCYYSTDWLLTATYKPYSEDFHIWPRAVSLPSSLCLFFPPCVSLLSWVMIKICSFQWNNHWLVSFWLAIYLSIYIFKNIDHINFCVWMPGFVLPYLKDCLLVLDWSQIGVHAPSFLALSTSTPFVHFIFHACSFTHLVACCSNLLISRLLLHLQMPLCLLLLSCFWPVWTEIALLHRLVFLK